MLLSIDIGSTWTKGAVFRNNKDNQLRLSFRTATPTTINDLADGFFKVLKQLKNHENIQDNEYNLHYSSSAKGGLAVAAIGIVPEMTSEMAKLAAFSAGAKVTQIFSYYLTQADISNLEKQQPDIILFAGGTDGGNEEYVRANALALSKSQIDCPIIYAGNRCIQDEITKLFHGKENFIIENILPEIDMPNPEPAREAIRSIFLSKITTGKGLDKIINKIGTAPVPTPYAVYEFCKSIQKYDTEWNEFILLDLGGATTDVYSMYHERQESRNVLRGLPEPSLKRTVEGDLGMRVSALSVLDEGRQIIQSKLGISAQFEKFSEHVNYVNQYPDTIPENDMGRAYDNMLAGACFVSSCQRHAGRTHQVYTADGIATVQVGRDLTHVKRLIGSGGYLSKETGFMPNDWLSEIFLDSQNKRILIPSSVNYYRDHEYIIPLLANIARGEPEAAVEACIHYLTPTLN